MKPITLAKSPLSKTARQEEQDRQVGHTEVLAGRKRLGSASCRAAGTSSDALRFVLGGNAEVDHETNSNRGSIGHPDRVTGTSLVG